MDNRQIWDTLFRRLTNRYPDICADIAQGILGHPVSESDIKIVTLEETPCSPRHDDLAFTVEDKSVIMFEEQAGFTHNMPLRLQLYFSELVERMLPKSRSRIYTPNIVYISEPEFYVLLTGPIPKNMPEVDILSEVQGWYRKYPPDVEVRVHWITEDNVSSFNSEFLHEFLHCVNSVKSEIRVGKPITKAIAETINSGDRRYKYMLRLTEEDARIMLADMEAQGQFAFIDQYREDIKEEGRAEGRAEGREEERQHLEAELGMSLEEAKRFIKSHRSGGPMGPLEWE